MTAKALPDFLLRFGHGLLFGCYRILHILSKFLQQLANILLALSPKTLCSSVASVTSVLFTGTSKAMKAVSKLKVASSV